MTPKIIERDGKTITVNCGDTCQKVTEASIHVGMVVIGVPLMLSFAFIYGQVLYWLLVLVSGGKCPEVSSHSCDTVLQAIGAFLGTIATMVLCGFAIGYAVTNWNARR